ncbi:MAG: hypothetical protein ABFR75_05475 [Acidobacteriota bacterium]
MKNPTKRKNSKPEYDPGRKHLKKKYKNCQFSSEIWASIETDIKDKIRSERSLFLNSALHSSGIN